MTCRILKKQYAMNWGNLNNSTISSLHQIVVMMGNCSTSAFGNKEPSFYYAVDNLHFARSGVISLSSPSYGSNCYSIGNLGNPWNCQEGSWRNDPQRPALMMKRVIGKYV